MKSVYEILEFDKILDKISDYAALSKSKSDISNLMPLSDINLIRKKYNEVDAATAYIRGGYLINIPKITDVYESALRLEKNALLSQIELLNISHLLDAAENLIQLKRKRDLHTELDDYIDFLNPLTNENNQIKRIVLSETEIADNASTILQSIRRKKKILDEKIHTIANRLLNTYEEFLQDKVVVSKDNALCLPVKSEFKNKIEGTVHSVSESQSTFFIEPKEIIEISNEIAENTALEEIEITKILYSLSNSLSPYIDILKTNYNNISYIDVTFAKAKYAYDNGHTLPTINDNGYINLIDAKHPLIKKDQIVPLNLSLGQKYTTLIITGPNTGGKTVSLKTVGLIELMALSGLFIPTKENSTVSFFDNIYADIGDEQSIEQSLSTFSSHMNNIVTIINQATNKSLVLFDEICTGTDPIEGASLAIAILEYLKEKNTLVIATTHYPELKQYAISTPNVENGAFEFNVETLLPTYRLLIGIPGKSNAFAISSKLGLNKGIIENAKKHLNVSDVKFEDLIANLEENRKTIELEKKQIDEYKDEIEKLREKVKRQEKGLNERADSIIRQAKEKAHDILFDAKKIADDTIKNIRDNGSDMSIAISERSKISKSLKESTENLIEKTKGPSKPISAKKIKLGSNVKVLSLNSEGIVESLPDKNYNLYVRIGILRTLVNLRDLELINTNNIKIEGVNIKKTYNHAGSSKIKYEKSRIVNPEINLIGQTTDEAILSLDKYVDDAYIAHIRTIRIIHGRGTGALKKAINEYCRKSAVIIEYRSGNFDEGGDGVTVATLKDQ